MSLPVLKKDRFDLARALRGDFLKDFWADFDSTFTDIFDDVRYLDKEGNLVHEIECPGFNKDNLTLDITDGILTIQGERIVEGEYVGSSKIYRRARVSASEKVSAEIKDGILYLTIEKPKKESTKIEIK